MLRLAVAFVLLTCLAPTFGAYVTDRVELPLFAAPNADAEVRAFVPAGQNVRELERRGDFARVKTQAGDEGWLALEHLSDQPVGATHEVELKSLNEALNAELKALRAEVERLKNDLLDSEETRKRQIHAISRSTENEIETLRRELEALRVVRASTQPASKSATEDTDELSRLRAELKALRAEQARHRSGRIPSETLREMERLANESHAAKEKLAQAQSRARRLAAVAARAPAPGTAPDMALHGSIGPWHWTFIGAGALMMFGLGNLFADYRARKRHGGYRL